MNRLIIIPADGYVSIDGIGVHGVDLSSVSPDIHAVQWYGDHGEIEFRNGSPNRHVDNLPDFSAAVDAYHARVIEIKRGTPPNPYSAWDDATNEWVDDATLKAEWDRQAEIAGLRTDLASTDWIIAKIGERQLMGDDIAPLLSKYADTIEQREAARARINELKAQTPEA